MTHPLSPGEAGLDLAIKADGLPEPRAAYRLALSWGKHKHVVLDFAWPDRKLAVEVDGGRWVPRGVSYHAGDEHHRRQHKGD